MRQKKSKTLFYILILAVLAGIVFVASREFSAPTEQVELPLENEFLSNR